MNESLDLATGNPVNEPSRCHPNEFDDSIESLLATGIVQQLMRTQLAGTDQITGIFRCDFSQEQDRYALNIPIHPALSAIPAVEAIALESDARIRVTDRQKFGVRLEVVLNRAAAEPQQVFVDVVIACSL